MKRTGWVVLLCCLLIALLCVGCKPAKTDTTDNKEQNDQKTPETDDKTNDDTKTDDDTVPPSIVDANLTVDKIIGLIGKKESDVKDTLGQNAELSDDANGNRVYKTKILNEDATVTFIKGTDDTIESITVTVNKTASEKWKTELIDRYGEAANDVWEKDDANIKMTTSVDNTVFTITKVKK